MKFLILTCNTGGGHHATAAAISEYFTAQGQECVTLDCLDFLSPAKAKLISEGHVLLYRRAPKLFGIGYRFEENHMPKLILAQCESCADEFYEAVQKVGCDAVINVHVFSALIMSAAKRLYVLELPGYFVATDYTCSPGVGCSDQDVYFIPHKELTEEFVACGVPADRIVPTGIPVRPVFYETNPREAARRTLELPLTGKLVLLTCGSNEKLKKDLEKDRLSGRVQIVGFTREMDLYMDAADLILTKAGGLSTTEALMKRLPIVYVDAVPGCETRNLEFMVRHGFAQTADAPEDLSMLVCTLLHDPDRLAQQRSAIAEAFPDRAVEAIYRHLKHLQVF